MNETYREITQKQTVAALEAQRDRQRLRADTLDKENIVLRETVTALMNLIRLDKP